MATAAQMAWIAICVATVTLLGPDALRSQVSQLQQVPAEPQANPPNERQNNSRAPDTSPAPLLPGVTPLETPEAPSAGRTAQTEGEFKQGNWLHDFLHEMRVTDALLVIFTGLLVIFTGLLWRATQRLWQSASAANALTMENSIASRRAWVAIQAVKLKHPTSFTNDEAAFGIELTIRNYGSTPATSVEVDVESLFLHGSGERFADAERRFKEKLRSHPVELGNLLFPNDTLVQGITWADRAEKYKHSIRSVPSGQQTINVIILVGVTYRIIGGSKAHITFHAHDMLNVEIGTTVPVGQLVDMPRMPFLAGEAD